MGEFFQDIVAQNLRCKFRIYVPFYHQMGLVDGENTNSRSDISQSTEVVPQELRGGEDESKCRIFLAIL